MAKTKSQKNEIVSKATEDIASAKVLLFADFSGTPVKDLSALRRTLRDAGAKMGVVKKRLLDIVLKGRGINFKAQEFAPGQLATIFVRSDISEAAGPLYRFSKDREKFQILGGFDLLKNELMSAATVKIIGQLPPRPVMLGQLLGTLVAPIRAFMYLVQEKGKRSSS
ncbi:MAG: 50S ribosomal protein L10 [Candidatus Colwellbacteria bacterium CG_4_9_14_0_2_um_filter_50_12]|uniref:Large ribosomal subunit protein uL10 n=1 Tax=Candidatus Colwellbacteria bacterium CG_4_9_14_0_2_um_filter_50_12 TaxID=1974538 RepID=A0A2M8G1Z5_9BACT|nr:MAG: 50S ribosomal protein L10 [Candidatus Colwellbacteria bacterium CG_4_9_14_0_2_um_filter_50_12]